MAAKECPLCGETMRRHTRKSIERVPGSAQTTSVTRVEWVCPECDYFEDAEEGTD